VAERAVTGRDGDGRTGVGRLGGRVGVLAFLVAVWMMLWGSTSWVTALGGLVLALAITTAFPQRPAPLGLGPYPGRLLAAGAWVLFDIARSTVAVAWAAVRTGPATRAELVTVSVPPCAGDVLLLTSSLISISPGTMVVEIDTQRRELLVHVLPVADVERSRADLQRTTDRLVGALQGGGRR
jgi:multicomponent Na+:H+ antiporter subunit E